MPRKNAPEMSWLEDKKLYRKQIKNPTTGKWTAIYGKTKQEVRDKVKAQERQWQEDAAAADSPFMYQYAAQWYKLNTQGLSRSRQEDYSNAINNHICPVIGNMPLSDVKPDDIKKVMAAAANMSKSSQQKIVTTLKRIFESAEENELIGKSPCRNLKPGGAPPAEKVALTDAQCKTLTEAVRGTRAYIVVMLGLYAGLRREEIVALKWDCVHLDAATPYIEVRRAVRWINNNKPEISEKLKSRKAQRNIPIAQQLKEALEEAKAKSTSDYVVPNTKGDVMSYSSFVRLWDIIETRSVGTISRKVKKEREAEKDGGPEKEIRTREKKLGDKVKNHKVTITIDFPVTPHTLRHTFITNLILAGANVKTVQYLAGHATAQITLNIYTHLMENQPEETVDAITAAYGPTKDINQDTDSGSVSKI